jgi:hypothetical protein
VLQQHAVALQRQAVALAVTRKSGMMVVQKLQLDEEEGGGWEAPMLTKENETTVQKKQKHLCRERTRFHT